MLNVRKNIDNMPTLQGFYNDRQAKKPYNNPHKTRAIPVKTPRFDFFCNGVLCNAIGIHFGRVLVFLVGRI